MATAKRPSSNSTIPFTDVRMELMTSRQVQQYQKKSDLVVLPVGCFEMHGPQVPLGCDSFIDWAMALLLARQWKALCLPPVYYTFPGASGPWPGTVAISNRATIDYVQSIIGALMENGFGRVAVVGSHGPLAAMMQCISGDIMLKTGKPVVHIKPYGRIQAKMDEAGLPYGEPGVVLGAMKLLGLADAFQPETNVDRPCEFPLPSVGKLRKCLAHAPWLFAKDYQHTGMFKGLKSEHADRIAEVLTEVAAEAKDMPRHFASYQREVAAVYKNKPWRDDKNWTRTR